MKKLFCFSPIAILLVLLLISSCTSRTGNHPHAVSEAQYHISPRVDSVVKYYYNISSQVQSHYEVNDKKIESGGQSDLGLLFSMSKDSNDGIIARITYDKLHVLLDNGGEKKDFTARKGDSAADPVEQMLGNILGAVLTVTLDRKGNIRQVSGSKELSQKIFGAMGGVDPTVKKTIESQVGKLTGEEFIRSTLQQVFKLVPDSIKYVGDSWSNTQQSEGVKLTVVTTYTLAKVDDHIAQVDGKSTIRDEGESPISFLGQDFPAEISGDQESHFKVDVNSGMVLQGHSNLTLKGKIQVFGKEVPIRFKSEKTIEGKKI